MLFGLLGVVIIGALTGAASERLGLTRNGYPVAAALGVGGAVILWFVLGILGLSFGLGRTGISIAGAAAMLYLASRRR